MFLEQETAEKLHVPVPESLRPSFDRQLPELTAETMHALREAGWSRVGLMVAFVDTDGNVMMLEHNGRDKNNAGALGPLGESSKWNDPVVEQPLETLIRGMREELGVEDPADLELFMHSAGGWVINQWPVGTDYPGQFACAISFPVFVPDSIKSYLLSLPQRTKETNGMHFVAPEQILAADEALLRPGVKSWLRQMAEAGLFEPEQFGQLEPASFQHIYQAGLRDIDLQA